jgi:hypothetical protein
MFAVLSNRVWLPRLINVALFLAKWLETVEEEKQSGILDEEEREILTRLQDLMSQTELNIQDVSLSAVVLELGAGLLIETWVYGCKSLKWLISSSVGGGSGVSTASKTLSGEDWLMVDRQVDIVIAVVCVKNLRHSEIRPKCCRSSLLSLSRYHCTSNRASNMGITFAQALQYGVICGLTGGVGGLAGRRS